MSIFSCYIHLQNEQFQSMIRELCEQYMVRSMYREAVNWYQWMARDNGIYLGPSKQQFFSGEHSSADVLLVRFNFFDQWLGAYLIVLESAGQDMVYSEAFAHMTVACQLLNQLANISKQWNTLPMPNILQDIGQSRESVGMVLSGIYTDKYKRGLLLTKNLVNGALTDQLKLTSDTDGQFELEAVATTTSPTNFGNIFGPEELEIYVITPDDEENNNKPGSSEYQFLGDRKLPA